jgi:hypothetical protein
MPSTAASSAAARRRSPLRRSKARREREGWHRDARMWAVGMPLLAAGYLLADEGDALAAAAVIWTVILAIDLLVSSRTRLVPAVPVHEPRP